MNYNERLKWNEMIFIINEIMSGYDMLSGKMSDVAKDSKCLTGHIEFKVPEETKELYQVAQSQYYAFFNELIKFMESSKSDEVYKDIYKALHRLP